jgi:protein-S-isoprenylcysteine O-methyltransferase Ste14
MRKGTASAQILLTRGKVCDTGLFSWTRHPNYFGEIIMQFSIFMIVLSLSAYGCIPFGLEALCRAVLGDSQPDLPGSSAHVCLRFDAAGAVRREEESMKVGRDGTVPFGGTITHHRMPPNTVTARVA